MSYITKHTFSEQSTIDAQLELFKTLWNTSNDNMFIVKRDLNGDYINEKSNPALENTFHVEDGATDNKNLKEILETEVYEKISQRYDECINKKLPITYEESHIIHNDEQRFWLTTILPVVCKDSNITKILGISREITPIRNAEIALQRHNETLEEEVKKRTIELQETLTQMENIAITDKLTSLYNRHKLDNVLNDEINISRRYKTQFGVLLLDIDDFKKVNDIYGHAIGDTILQEFAIILSRSARGTDTIGRWGGEEFLIITPQSDKTSILEFTHKLKETIQAHSFKEVGQITASIGVSLYKSDDTIQSLLKRVDKALYTSKNKGKNIISFH